MKYQVYLFGAEQESNLQSITWHSYFISILLEVNSGRRQKLYFHIPFIKGRNIHIIRLPTSINTKMQCL